MLSGGSFLLFPNWIKVHCHFVFYLFVGSRIEEKGSAGIEMKLKDRCQINNTSNLRKRDLYLAHNSKGIVYPSREGMVAEGTQSLAVGACGIACLCCSRSQNRESPVQAGLGYSSQDPSSNLLFPLARLHLRSVI